ncbi:hypothetical protein [Arthrobacter sp. GMC3]|uniref:hypothetical protein n=1 Tax=Arthrobacter sp. GMC3 TaxID=2058894 RepID=UPI000CE3AD62|nr:hypothetical protein [Arthrobacter sp. GMC3]
MQRISFFRKELPDAQLNAFIEANGLDPKEVIADQVATIENGQLTVVIFSQGLDGKKILNGLGDAYMKQSKTVPLISAPENFGL